MAERPDLETLVTVFYYCASIIVFPVLTFFLTKMFLFEGLFGMTTIANNICSAVAAVIVLHVALGLFIHRAYSEPGPGPGPKPSKVD